MTEDQRQTIYQHLAEGKLGLHAIAKRVGVFPTTVYRIAKRRREEAAVQAALEQKQSTDIVEAKREIKHKRSEQDMIYAYRLSLRKLYPVEERAQNLVALARNTQTPLVSMRAHEVIDRIDGFSKGDDSNVQAPGPIFVLPEGTPSVRR